MFTKHTGTIFKKKVWDYYKKYGRHDLPWRKTKNPYHILVSEVMLQQTQVARVEAKYKQFLKLFPTLQSLASASQKEVLTCWQGLGYNSRAKRLQEAARVVVEQYAGRLPRQYDELVRLPGIGPYTAAAVCNFAYNTPVATIETNVRTAFFYHFFAHENNVTDKELLECAEALIDTKHPRQWHWALMDYGAYLKGTGVQLNSKSIHYSKQSVFKGSSRELRGAIVRILAKKAKSTTKALACRLERDIEDVQAQLTKLEREGMVVKEGRSWRL